MENSTLFKLIQQSLFDQDNLCEINADESDYAEMKGQTIAALPGDIIDGINMSQQLKEEWKEHVVLTIMSYTRIMREQQRMTDLLAANGIKVVILKGISAGMYYPNPRYREMGDVDFIVAKDDFEKAYGILKEAGYRDVHGYNPRHVLLIKNRVSFELHHHFSESVNRDEEYYLDSVLQNAIESAEVHYDSDYSWHSFGYIENGLVLLQHMKVHLFTGLGLRQVIDWMMYINSGMTEEKWKIFAPLAEKCGNKKLAIIITRMCELYLGLPELYPWADDADAADCEKLMNYILAKGNFGTKKNDASSRTISALNYGGRNIIDRFRYEQLSGLSHWKAAGKYKTLRPFAWIYGIGHHIAMLRQDGETIESIINGIKESKKQRALLKGLIDGE